MDRADLEKLPLGKQSTQLRHYDPGQLCAVPRLQTWSEYGHPTAPFNGVDIWNAWEVSWLNSKGLPRVAVGEFRVPAASTHIIESKSMKLYLNSFSHSRFDDQDSVSSTIARDLSECAGQSVEVRLIALDEFEDSPSMPGGQCLDALDITIDSYSRDARLLHCEGPPVDDEKLFSHLLKSNCPVTGQPDWGSVFVQYSGEAIDKEGLLRYIVSYRDETEFHEHCVETMFLDIMQQCRPAALSVYARYLRRGGIDINPYRSTDNSIPPNTRWLRQ